jgi:integrase/recombinase XerD
MDKLEEFRQYLFQIGYSKSSQYQIPYCVQEFLSQTKKSIQCIEQQDIQNFYIYLQTRPLKHRAGAISERMISHYIYGIKLFFSWLEQTEIITENPMSNLRFKQAKVNPSEPLSPNEITVLFSATETDRERAILHLFYSCGLRRTEAENLNTADIHFAKNIVYVRAGKGAKRRAIPINETIKLVLENYYKNERIHSDEKAFILNQHNTRMKGDQYNNLLKRIIQKTNNPPLEGREITLHHLRHSIATHLVENGLKIEFIRDFLGHSHLEATQIYAKVYPNQLKDL